MKLLVLGGTVFVGRHIVEAALGAGHEVTLFNRGASGAGLYPTAARLVGDRNGDHAALDSGRWDAVIDTTSYRPWQTRSAMARLRGRAGLYALVSTVSVYRDFAAGGDEGAPVLDPVADETFRERVETAEYGPLKRSCELAVEREWGGPWLVARPGLIAGPYDASDRFTYWAARLARGGRFLAPGAPDRSCQFIDARDMAAWLVSSVEAGRTGTFNLVGEDLPLGKVLADCARAARKPFEPVWADDAFLAAHEVAPFTDMPLWLPAPVRGFSAAKALAAGLKRRSTLKTATDVLRWHLQRGAPPLKAGLPQEKESRLLAALAGGA